MSNVGPVSRSATEPTQSQAEQKLNPSEFALMVRMYSQRNARFSYPGLHYASLARLLISPLQTLGDSEGMNIVDVPSTEIFIHELGPGRPEPIVKVTSIEQLKNYDEDTRKKQPSGRLLFMEGFVSPLWLNHLGSKFDIDPEFYFRHLDFSSSLPHPTHFPMPSLPSAADVVRLRLISIISRNAFQPSTDSIEGLRSACKNHMNEYLMRLSRGQGIESSDSIMRQFYVHDKYHFSMEQMITIQVNTDGQGWIALIWLDQGRDLHFSRNSPWSELQRGSSANLSIQPVIQYRRRIALRTAGPDFDERQLSSGSLPSMYGRSLRPELMAVDAFYALEELFRLSIASEASFLVLLSHKIKEATSEGRIEDLRHALEILKDHIEFTIENIESVNVGGHPKWPKAPEPLRSRATESKNRLQKDLEHLLAKAERLAAQCGDGMTMILNESMFRQSQLALDETKATVKLGVLVFFFAPISLTTAIFSMDVREISKGQLSIWVWAVTSILTVVVSFMFWKWEPLDWLRRRCRRS